jgi:PAS domain S-box-containing protein
MSHFTDVAHRLRSLFRHADVMDVSPAEIEARMLAAETLARNEERLRLALEATALGTFEWDIATDRVRCSPRVKKQFGFSSDEALTLESVLSRIHPADREAVRATIRAAMESDGSRTYAGEFRTLLPDGHSDWIDARGAVLFGTADPRPQSMIGIVLDITERKNQQLRVDRSAADLDTANHLKDEFMAAVAHKLRCPLTPIRNGLDILALSGGADPTLRKACELMGRQLQYLVHLVDELLDASLVARGTLNLNRQLVTLQSVVRHAVEIVREQLDASARELRVEVTKAPVLLEADPQRIAQAVANIVENAIRYTPPQGRIILRAGADANGATIQVIDNGAGVSPVLLPRVFELFAAKAPPDPAHSSGLGIGLALAHALVKMHGGSMSVVSDGLDTGSSFRIWLPVPNGPGAVSPRAIARLPPLPRRKILLIDGNRDSAELKLTLLQLMGQDVRHVESGPHALELVAQFAPQIVLADQDTVDVDSYATLRGIRALSLPEPPVLVLVGDGDVRPSKHAGALPFDSYLRTPVDAAAMASLLRHPPPVEGPPNRASTSARDLSEPVFPRERA